MTDQNSPLRPAKKPVDAAQQALAMADKRSHADGDMPVLPPSDDQAGFEPHVQGVDYGVLDGLLGYAVRRAQIAIYADFVKSLARWNITPPRFAALVLISRNTNLKLTNLASIMGIARSGAVMLIDALEELGYVQRRPSTEDKRAFSLVLTAQGRESLEVITHAIQEHDARVSQALNSEEREQLRNLLGRLAQGAL